MDGNSNGILEEAEARLALASIHLTSLGEDNGAQAEKILKLVQVGGGRTADATFEGGRYEVVLLDKDEVFYRAGTGAKKLGQFFSRVPYVNVAQVRSGVAVKDDWDEAGVTLREVLRPRVDTVFAITVPAGTVAYVGKAAPLEAFMDVDSLAKRVFHGGSEQILIVRPWEMGGDQWPCEASPLDRGAFWDVLMYEPTPLCRAAHDGDLDAIRAAVAAAGEGRGVNEASAVLGFGPMHHAAIGGSAEAVRELAGLGGDAGAANHMGLTPLMLAAICGNEDALGALLAVPGVDPNAAEEQLGRTALHLAAMEGVEGCVRCLAAHAGVSLDQTAKDGTSPLWMAASGGWCGVVGALVGAGGVDLERACKAVTPLQCALLRKRGDVMRVLLAAKAFPLPLPDGTGLLAAAFARRSEECVRALVSKEGVKAGVDPNQKVPRVGTTILCLAARAGEKGIVEALVECRQVKGQLVDEDGEGVLHSAVRGRSEACVAAVGKVTGLKPNLRNHDGYTALYMAVGMGDVGVVREVCNLEGIDVEVADKDGWTPLHVAANKDMVEIARILCKAGADVRATNQNATPGDLAKSDEMKAVLREAPTAKAPIKKPKKKR